MHPTANTNTVSVRASTFLSAPPWAQFKKKSRSSWNFSCHSWLATFFFLPSFFGVSCELLISSIKGMGFFFLWLFSIEVLPAVTCFLITLNLLCLTSWKCCSFLFCYWSTPRFANHVVTFAHINASQSPSYKLGRFKCNSLAESIILPSSWRVWFHCIVKTCKSIANTIGVKLCSDHDYVLENCLKKKGLRNANLTD